MGKITEKNGGQMGEAMQIRRVQMVKTLPRHVFFDDDLQAGLIGTGCTTEHEALMGDGKDTKPLQKKP